MVDVLMTFDGQLLAGDISQVGPGLEADPGLRTAIIISLFTDARASGDDELPAGEADRRGWWGDMLATKVGDITGSRRWLYVREKQTAETAEKIRAADQAALQWLVDDGIAVAVSVATGWNGRGILGERIVITKPSGDDVEFSFNQLWEAV